MPRMAGRNGDATSSRRPRTREPPRQPLSFDDKDQPPRSGDAVPTQQARAEFPPARTRKAGLTGGETPERDEVTADDLTPETLLDDDPSHTPDAGGRDPNDAVLRALDAGRSGVSVGADEAELAEQRPVGHKEAERLRHLAERHARDLNAVEPYEAAMQYELHRSRRRRHH